MEYCASIRSPYLAKDINVLEKVQRRAAELIISISTLTYDAGLEELDLICAHYFAKDKEVT